MRAVPLPPCLPGGAHPGALEAAIAGWVNSPPMADLLDCFDADFAAAPPVGPLGPVLARLAAFSAEYWDYRRGLERYQMARLNLAPDLDVRVRAAVEALGFAGPARPAADRYDHVLVLGGGIRILHARVEHAARLLGEGLRAGRIGGLGSLRETIDREKREALKLGLGEQKTEAQVMDTAMVNALGLGAPEDVRDGVNGAGQDWWARRYASAHGPVHVLAAPASRPGQRANTADTLAGWAEHVARPEPDHRVLIVTSDADVPFQHCDAIRVLGVPYGCGVETVGLDPDITTFWLEPLSTTQLLQELNSAIRSMRLLHTALPSPRLPPSR
jgi:hypothetical protein